MRTYHSPLVLLVVMMIFMGQGCSRNIIKLTIQVPTEARIKLDKNERIAVMDFLSSETRFSPGKEAAKLLRADLTNDLEMTVADSSETVKAIKSFEDTQRGQVMKGSEYFQLLGREMNVDSIFGGTVSFQNKDLSGYERKEFVHPTTGAVYYKDVWVDKLGIEIEMEVYLVRVGDGEYLMKEKFTDTTEISKENSSTPIYGFYALIENQVTKLISQLAPQDRSEIRYLLR